jgi:hypothetical protein
LNPCATLQKCTSDIRDKYTSVTTSRSNRLLLGNNNHLSKPDKGLRVTTSAWHSCRNKHNVALHGSRDSVVGVVTRRRAGRSGVRIPVRPEYFYLLQFIHTGFEAQPVSYSTGTRALSHGQSGRGVKLTTRIIRVLRLRLTSFSLLLLLYAIMVSTRTTLPTSVPFCKRLSSRRKQNIGKYHLR